MISEKEQERIRLLSDTELYPQAVEFMQRMGGTLPRTQINGLLNVALANTYEQLEKFIQHQYERKSWKRDEQHIPGFYRKLEQKLKDIERLVAVVTRERQEKFSQDEEKTVKMLLAREFIQHILAENDYKSVQNQPDRNAPQGGQRTAYHRPDGRYQGNNQGSTIR